MFENKNWPKREWQTILHNPTRLEVNVKQKLAQKWLNLKGLVTSIAKTEEIY